jgi:arsenate reductase
MKMDTADMEPDNLAKVYNVLFLCTGNSARSVMAECAMQRWGQGKFKGYSAGSHPKGEVHPMTLRLLERLNYRTGSLRSKSWDEFARQGGPPLDFVFTVCDQAAGEVCPVWPGQPMSAHWGVDDPAAYVGDDEQTYRRFRNVYGQLENRIKIFASLPIRSLDRLTLQKRIEEIGRERKDSAAADLREGGVRDEGAAP